MDVKVDEQFLDTAQKIQLSYLFGSTVNRIRICNIRNH